MNNGYGPAKVATRGGFANYQCDNTTIPKPQAMPIVKRAVRNLARPILGITKLNRHTPNVIKHRHIRTFPTIYAAVGQANQHYREHKICACEVEGTQ